MPVRTIRRITTSQSIALIFVGIVIVVATLATRRLVRQAADDRHSFEIRVTLQALRASLNGSDAPADTANQLALHVAALVATDSTQLVLARALPALIAHRADRPAAAQVAVVIAAMDSAAATSLATRASAERDSQLALAITLIALLALAIAITWLMRRSLVRDLRERARIETQLRDSEARYSGILAIAADAIISIDESRTIVHFNHAAELMFGYPTADVVGRQLEILLPAGKAAAHPAHVADFARSADTARRMGERQEVSGRRRDGTEFPADVSISKLTTPTGMLFTAVVRDVTTQRRLEHHEHTLAVAGARLGATLEYEAMLRLVVELPVHSIGDWSILDIIERHDDGPDTVRRVASSHSELSRHTALRAIEARGIDWDSPSEVIDVIRTGQATLHPAVSVDWLEAHTPDAVALVEIDQLGMQSLLCVPLTIRGKAFGALTIGRHAAALATEDLMLAAVLADQSARAIDNTLLYQRAQLARAARDQVLAVVSHDLRTPASAITMCARTLLDHPPETNADRRNLYATILESADWMYRLIEDLLDAASIDAGQLAINTEPTAVSGIIQAAAESFAERARNASIVIEAHADDGLPDILADRGRILQVLGNLLTNALRFTAGGGTIALAAARHPDGVMITVRDTGTGIDADNLPHIFDRFWHIGGVGRGSGLGLAIASGIVQAHGGYIWVDSVIGKGSIFSFVIPATQRSA